MIKKFRDIQYVIHNYYNTIYILLTRKETFYMNLENKQIG